MFSREEQVAESALSDLAAEWKLPVLGGGFLWRKLQPQLYCTSIERNFGVVCLRRVNVAKHARNILDMYNFLFSATRKLSVRWNRVTDWLVYVLACWIFFNCIVFHFDNESTQITWFFFAWIIKKISKRNRVSAAATKVDFQLPVWFLYPLDARRVFDSFYNYKSL